MWFVRPSERKYIKHRHRRHGKLERGQNQPCRPFEDPNYRPSFRPVPSTLLTKTPPLATCQASLRPGSRSSTPLLLLLENRDIGERRIYIKWGTAYLHASLNAASTVRHCLHNTCQFPPHSSYGSDLTTFRARVHALDPLSKKGDTASNFSLHATTCLARPQNSSTRTPRSP